MGFEITTTVQEIILLTIQHLSNILLIPMLPIDLVVTKFKITKPHPALSTNCKRRPQSINHHVATHHSCH
ncbi:hypothetical protein QVD17_24272 [Tagetes erecta]|uniref:Uncharacterized protein n=1 Tax=Tagetes erecta TaxID=13708 RepID=A0AAD8KEY0_TARER|nr:hypothetical protein QVD17_24272 [Tagetes erecta]